MKIKFVDVRVILLQETSHAWKVRRFEGQKAVWVRKCDAELYEADEKDGARQMTMPLAASEHYRIRP